MQRQRRLILAQVGRAKAEEARRHAMNHYCVPFPPGPPYIYPNRGRREPHRHPCVSCVFFFFLAHVFQLARLFCKCARVASVFVHLPFAERVFVERSARRLCGTKATKVPIAPGRRAKAKANWAGGPRQRYQTLRLHLRCRGAPANGNPGRPILCCAPLLLPLLLPLLEGYIRVYDHQRRNRGVTYVYQPTNYITLVCVRHARRLGDSCELFV